MSYAGVGQLVQGECDFRQGPLVSRVQRRLGVPETGTFDKPTCEAYQRLTGETQPSAMRLMQAAFDDPAASCVSPLMPECGLPWKRWAIAAGAVFVAYAVFAGGVISWHRGKGRS